MNKKARRAPGMVDVAKLAGVSHQTVSRVLNGSDKVAPATRKSVEAAIRELGYRRNSVARALVTRRSGIIGIISAAEPAYGPSSMLLNVEIAARRAGFYTGVAPILNWTAESVRSAVDHLLSLAVEAIVAIVPFEHDLDSESLGDIRVPIIAVTGGTEFSGTSAQNVRVDQEGAVNQIIDHLVSLGHKRIAHIEGPQTWFDARARKESWENALAANGLKPEKSCGGGWDAETGYHAAKCFLKEDPPTAIFAANDVLAIGAINAFTEEGISVPDDISIVGFDDIPGAGYLLPPLTTVKQDFEKLGDAVVSAIKSAIAGADPSPAIEVPASLIVRGSTARPRA